MSLMHELEILLQNQPKLGDIQPSHSRDVTVFINNLLNHINACEASREKVEVVFGKLKQQLKDEFAVHTQPIGPYTTTKDVYIHNYMIKFLKRLGVDEEGEPTK